MADNASPTLETVETRLTGLEKRFDDLKWYFGGVAAIVTAGIAVYSILIGMNFNNEKASLQTFRTEMREDLGKSQKAPELELLAADGHPLSGASITGSQGPNQGKTFKLTFEHVIRNSGNGSSGPMTAKFYANAPNFKVLSSDETGFKYEYYMDTDLHPDEVPGGGYSSRYDMSLSIEGALKPGTYPMMTKIYYGGGKVVSSQFNLVLH